ncbi:MAG TPA: zf-HC2 domain-containing protein [Longimicrobiales bacterium]|nr:zf-HC2 domain-containing protein [Longimicrobiales bacterium]
MNEHPRDDVLQDLVSGSLDSGATSRIERHLEACPDCRAEVNALRSLVASLGDLPAAVLPGTDLRAGIWQRIDGEAATRPSAASPEDGSVASAALSTPPRLRFATGASRWPLATAALVLIAVTATVSIAIDRGISGRGEPADGAGGERAGATMRAAEARVESAARELEALLAEQTGMLAPATREVINNSLSAIDAAVAEARTALDGDPGNPMLSHMLMAAWEKKLGVLRAASQVPIGI